MPGLGIESEPNQFAGIRDVGGHLPGLLALARSPIRLAMAIAGLDSFHKLREGVLSMPGSEHDASIASEIERELVAFRQSCLFDN
jgi:hypothetical protein